MNLMRKQMLATVGLALALAAGLLTPATAGDEITPERYDAVLAELTPSADEPWRTVPWELRVLDAQRMAVEQDKPIFIWAMDGHPLGCT